MSTKTTFKRIALVAVAALGFGMVSAVPSFATTSATPFAITAAQGSLPVTAAATMTATQLSGPNNYVELTATADYSDTSTVTVSVSGSTISTFSLGTNGTTANTLLNAAATVLTYTDGDKMETSLIRIPTTVAGTITVTVASRSVTAGVVTATPRQTITFTVIDRKVWSDRYSTATTSAGAAVNSTTGVWASGETVYGPKGALNDSATNVADITFDFEDATDVDLNATTGTFPAVRAAIKSGPGNLKWGSEAAIGRDVSLVTTAQAPVLNVFNDGTSGTAVIEIFVGGATTASFTKSVSFYGAVTSLVAAQGLFVADAAGGAWGCGASSCAATSVATTPAATITAKDANGTLVPYLSLAATSSSTTDFSSSVAIAQSATSPGTYYSDVVVVGNGKSGKTASYTWASGTVTTNALTYALGTAMTAVAFTVTPGAGLGQVGTMAVALTDASANKPYDASYAFALKTNVSLTGSIAPASATTMKQDGTATNYIVLNGAGSWTFFNPLVAGDVSFAGSTFGGLAVTASFTVTNEAVSAAADLAAEALDAANAATDAANAAAEAADAATAAAQDAADAVAALATQVATYISNLRKQITALTNLVVKIQKKVKA
jgi:trimeric autotransporter adhesin